MDTRTDNANHRGLREWWLTPPRPGLQRLISPWEYRRLRLCGVTRIAGGSAGIAAALICLSYAVYGWAAFFIVLATGNLAGGYWYLSIDRSGSVAGPRRPTPAWRNGPRPTSTAPNPGP